MELGIAEKTIAAREALHVDPGPDFILRGSDLTIKIPGEKLGLDQGVVLGRNTSEADVILDKSEISRTHLRFIIRDDKIYADDLGSANGTILNGARLSAGRPMALHNNDEITLAGIIFIVEGL
jgi:predicted component of type VI protein secretion system